MNVVGNKNFGGTSVPKCLVSYPLQSSERRLAAFMVSSSVKTKVTVEYSPSNGTLFFSNNIKSKMGILNLIRKIYFNEKTLTKNIF